MNLNDMNLNGQIDRNDTDRIVSNDTRYISLNGDWWRESSSWQTRQNGSSELALMGRSRTRLTGIGKNGEYPPTAQRSPEGAATRGAASSPLVQKGSVLISETRSLDPLNNVTISCSFLDRSSHTTTQTTLSPNSTLPAETVVQSGLTVSTRSPTGVTTTYAYDTAGRLVKEGSKTYTYGYLDKVMSVTEGDKTYTYTYHADGQLASANYGGKTEGFFWDGLALVRRGDEQFINEPHVGGGNPVASSKGTSCFNDALGTTVGAKKDGKYSAAALTAFGERLDNVDSTSPAIRSLGEGWFTGKPFVEGLGHTFLMRNYRASLAKWQSADPMGYPDGWNQLVYCGNGVVSRIDYQGCSWQTWDYYKNKTHETEDAWLADKRNHSSDYPIRLECGEWLVDSDVLVHEVYRGVGKEYDVYQQYYYDVYATDVYGGIDPLGKYRAWLFPAGVATGVAGLVITIAATGPAGIVAGAVIGVGGLAITVAGEAQPMNWELLRTIYDIRNMKTKYRKELRE